DVTGATVSDTLPASITGASWTVAYAGGGSGPASGSGDINAVVNLPVGASATFTPTGTIDAGATGTLVNTATVTPPTDVTDPESGNNSSTDTDTLVPTADVSIVKDGPASVVSGSTISYTLLVANSGTSAANGTTYSDTVPAAITGVAASCGGETGGATCAVPNVAGNTVSGAVPTLPPGGSVTITI